MEEELLIGRALPGEEDSINNQNTLVSGPKSKVCILSPQLSFLIPQISLGWGAVHWLVDLLAPRCRCQGLFHLMLFLAIVFFLASDVNTSFDSLSLGPFPHSDLLLFALMDFEACCIQGQRSLQRPQLFLTIFIHALSVQTLCLFPKHSTSEKLVLNK